MKKFIISIAVLIFIISIFVYLITTAIPPRDVYGTYFGEGDFGSVEVVVKEENDIIKYYFSFTDEKIKDLFATESYSLQFIADTEFNIPSFIKDDNKDNELFYRGVFKGSIRKPFTALNIKFDSYKATIDLSRDKK